jgi:hypothetical protein
MKRMGIPGLKWLTYLPDPVFSVVAREPWDYSSSLPTLCPYEPMLYWSQGHKGLLPRVVM